MVWWCHLLNVPRNITNKILHRKENMDDLGLNCAVCEEYFGNERPPRNLGCGHSVCEFCTTRILSVDKKCPECRQVIKAKSVSEMPINQPLLKLALSLVPGQSQLPHATVPSAPPSDCTRDELPSSSRSQADAGECTDHLNRLYFRCMKCKVWICETCLLSSHMSPPQGQCRTLPITQALQEMKRSYMQTSTSKIQFAEKLKRRLEKEITSLDGLREHKRRTTNFLQTTLQEIEIIVTKEDEQGKEASNRVSAMQELIDLLKDNKEKVKHATTPDEMKSTMDAAEEVLASVEKQILQEQHHHAVRIPLITSLNKQNLRSLLEVVEKGIFVNQCEGSHQQRWAKVTERDGLLHLHALQSLVKPPDGVIILPYDTVRNLVPNESPSVFMDIACGGQTRGRIYVRMFGNTIRGLQALYLCSGEKGPSYKGTCFYKSENLNGPLEILRGGDFENNNGSGGHAILNGITSGGAYKTEITAGLMVGWPVQDYWRLGSFDFYLRDCKGRHDNAAYGIVTNGIENLRSAARHKPVHESMVKDCGLVIPM